MTEPTSYPHLIMSAPINPTTRVYEGGGGGTYARTDYRIHAAKIFAEAQSLDALMRGQAAPDADATQRRYFRMVLPSDVSVWTTNGTKAATALHATLVGAPSRHVGHLSATKDTAALMFEELARYAGPAGVGKSKFAVLEEIGMIPAAEKISRQAEETLKRSDDRTSVLLSLFNDLTAVERRAVAQSIGLWLSQHSGSIESEVEGETGVYLRVRATPKVLRDAANTFLAIQSVDAVSYTLEHSSTPREIVDSSVIVEANKTSARAAIFDSGIDASSRFITANIFPPEDPIGIPHSRDHGTFVASRVIYGDTLRDQIALGKLTPSVKVLSVSTSTSDAVGNRRSASTEELLRIIKDTVARWHTQIRVYNLSQNLFPLELDVDATISDDVVSPLAAELDRLARLHRVLFVITAGNYPRAGDQYPPVTPYPDHFARDDARIVPPAEAVLALTVGSVAGRDNGGSLAKRDAPSPFTRRGPGFGGFCKPDVVANGGNYGQQWQQTDDLAVAGIGSHGDKLSTGCGTSYAAPLVTRLAAQLFELVPNATPELVRGLLIHFASECGDQNFPQIQQLIGHGRPNHDGLLSSSQWSQAFVYTGLLPHRSIQTLRFYVPKALVERQKKDRIRVRATVVCAPETERTLKAGYCKSHVSARLRKLNDAGTLCAAGENEARSDARMRYASVVRVEKTFSARVSAGDWALELEHESRWNLKDPNLPVAVVITIEDPRCDPAVNIPLAVRAEAAARYQTNLAVPQMIRL